MTQTEQTQQLTFQSIKNAMAKDKDAWLDLFADDAVVEDPVGKSMFEPTGEGHKGKAAIGQFFDTVIAPTNVEMEIAKSLPRANECANYIVVTHNLPNGEVYKMDMITLYKMNDEGKLVYLRAFWDFEGLMDVFAKAAAN